MDDSFIHEGLEKRERNEARSRSLRARLFFIYSIVSVTFFIVAASTLPIFDGVFSSLFNQPESDALSVALDGIVDPVDTPTYLDTVTMRGTKTQNASVRVAGIEVYAADAATTWSYDASLVLGTSTFIFEVYSSSADLSREIGTIVVDRYGLGDINYDGQVDIFDLGILVTFFGNNVGAGSEITAKMSDINGDTKVDIFDVGLLMGEYGRVTYDYENHEIDLPVPSATPPFTEGCKVGGCSSQLCIPESADGLTSCEYKDEYACYTNATCERQSDGECGWTMDAELAQCISNYPI